MRYNQPACPASIFSSGYEPLTLNVQAWAPIPLQLDARRPAPSAAHPGGSAPISLLPSLVGGPFRRAASRRLPVPAASLAQTPQPAANVRVLAPLHMPFARGLAGTGPREPPAALMPSPVSPPDLMRRSAGGGSSNSGESSALAAGRLLRHSLAVAPYRRDAGARTGLPVTSGAAAGTVALGVEQLHADVLALLRGDMGTSTAAIGSGDGGDDVLVGNGGGGRGGGGSRGPAVGAGVAAARDLRGTSSGGQRGSVTTPGSSNGGGGGSLHKGARSVGGTNGGSISPRSGLTTNGTDEQAAIRQLNTHASLESLRLPAAVKSAGSGGTGGGGALSHHSSASDSASPHDGVSRSEQREWSQLGRARSGGLPNGESPRRLQGELPSAIPRWPWDKHLSVSLDSAGAPSPASRGSTSVVAARSRLPAVPRFTHRVPGQPRHHHLVARRAGAVRRHPHCSRSRSPGKQPPLGNGGRPAAAASRRNRTLAEVLKTLFPEQFPSLVGREKMEMGVGWSRVG